MYTHAYPHTFTYETNSLFFPRSAQLQSFFRKQACCRPACVFFGLFFICLHFFDFVSAIQPGEGGKKGLDLGARAKLDSISFDDPSELAALALVQVCV